MLDVTAMRASFILLLAALLLSTVICTASAQVPEAWPEGEQAYDDMATLAGFGYRRIDTAPNFAARDWIVDVPIFLKLSIRNSSPKPGISFS